MGNTLYLECYSGISGDMAVAALLDLGASEQKLLKVLDGLSVDGFTTRISRVQKSGIDACDFAVVMDEGYENHDHDMEYLYGHNHVHEEGHTHHEHIHEEGHTHHNHVHEEGHTHHTHIHGKGHSHHEHRSINEIKQIIQESKMTERARALATRIFEILAQAEAKAHNKPIEEVHFHEVGAVDSIVDIISIAVCMDDLDIDEVIVPSLYEGCGTVRCQHGILPVPVPAVVNILQAYGIGIQIKNMQGEYITPTGAAFVAATRTKDALPENFIIKKIGLGAGKREYDGPGIVRAMLIEEQ